MSWFKTAQVNSRQVIDADYIEIHDVDRYRTDRYDCYFSVVKTATSYDVGFQINSSQLGVAVNVDYWHYQLNQRNEAVNTYNEIKKRATEVGKRFEEEKIPFALYGPQLRAALEDVDIDHKDISGIYHVNKNIRYRSEPDWRVTIYGPRYPRTPETGNLKDGFFAEQTKYQVQQPENKSFKTEGYGRNKSTRYE